MPCERCAEIIIPTHIEVYRMSHRDLHRATSHSIILNNNKFISKAYRKNYDVVVGVVKVVKEVSLCKLKIY